jgi:hypothetical protein
VLASAVVDNLLSAPVVAFIVAATFTLLGADVRLPEGLYGILSSYLLLAIGIKGGRGLGEATIDELWAPLLAAGALGVATPLIAYVLLRRAGRLDRVNGAGVAAHYGSVSAVTYTVVIGLLESRGEGYEAFLTGLLAILEVIGIVVALSIARSSAGASYGEAILEVIRGRSISMLLAGLAIGLVVGSERLASVDPLFVGLFQGVLTLFLLEMGVLAAQRLRNAGTFGLRIIALAVVIPLVNGLLGAAAGAAAGLSTGGVTVLATLAASASYIAAPAAVRIALPAADPGLSITAALGVTFPFNIIIGVSVYAAYAEWLT